MKIMKPFLAHLRMAGLTSVTCLDDSLLKCSDAKKCIDNINKPIIRKVPDNKKM